MKTTKWLTCALLGIGLALPVADILATSALAAEIEATGEASSEIRPDRRDKHNRQWRRAKARARAERRSGNPRKVLREFRRELNSADIVVNVCVVNVLNKAENVVAIGGDVNQVINIINGANCEIR
jgi:hypothetical protein